MHRLPADADAPRAGRDAAAEVIARLGCGDHRADDLALVVSEMVTNAVLHGSSAELELRFDCTPQTIRVEVIHGGVDQFEWPARGGDGHWGLQLVSIFGDRAGMIREPSTCVWCELDLDAPPAG